MLPSPPADAPLDDEDAAEPLRPPLRAPVLLILWPAFVMAGVLEALVFVVVEPASLRWFGAETLAWSANAVYSATFLIFWGAIATAGALTQLLAAPGPATEGLHR